MATGEFGSAATLRYAEAFADSDDYRLFELGKHVTDALNVGDECVRPHAQGGLHVSVDRSSSPLCLTHTRTQTRIPLLSNLHRASRVVLRSCNRA